MMFQEMGTTYKVIKIKKRTNRNSGKCNGRKENLTRGAQQQIWTSRRKSENLKMGQLRFCNLQNKKKKE